LIDTFLFDLLKLELIIFLSSKFSHFREFIYLKIWFKTGSFIVDSFNLLLKLSILYPWVPLLSTIIDGLFADAENEHIDFLFLLVRCRYSWEMLLLIF